MHTQQMDKEQWTIAHNLASDLINYDADPNEFGKVLAFMRKYKKADDAKDRFMLLLQRLANSNNAPIRSGKTQRYYQDIQKSCQKHLRSISDVSELILILGWCMRLMRYYKVEPKRATEEQRRPQAPVKAPKMPLTQTPKPPKVPKEPKFKIGDRINATVLKKLGSKVTVRLQTDENQELVFERPYYPGLVGAQVKLRVQGVNKDGEVTEVIP